MCTWRPQTQWNEVSRSSFDLCGGGMFDVSGLRISVFANKNFKNVPIFNLFFKKSTEAQLTPLHTLFYKCLKNLGACEWVSVYRTDITWHNISDQGLCILHPSVYCMSYLSNMYNSPNRYQVSFIQMSHKTIFFIYKWHVSQFRGIQSVVRFFFFYKEESQQRNLSVSEGACMLR